MTRARASVIGDGSPATGRSLSTSSNTERSRVHPLSLARRNTSCDTLQKQTTIFCTPSASSLLVTTKFAGFHARLACRATQQPCYAHATRNSSNFLQRGSISLRLTHFQMCVQSRYMGSFARGALDIFPSAFIASDVPMEEGNQRILDNKFPAGVQSKFFLMHVHFVSAR